MILVLVSGSFQYMLNGSKVTLLAFMMKEKLIDL